MYYYFSSDFPSAIKFNGIYYGVLTDTVKRLKIENDFSPFVEVCPLNGGTGQFSFILDQKFLTCPPCFCSITDLKGGYLVKFSKQNSPGDFKIIAQQKHPDAVLTLFYESGTKLSIETAKDFYAETFSFSVDTAEFNRFYLGGSEFVAMFITNLNLLCVYNVSDKITKVFSRVVVSYHLENGFTTTETHKDMAKHTVTSIWQEENGRLKEQSKKIECAPSFNRDRLPTPLIPYAFLEEFFVGGDFLFYTSGSVKEHADRLKDFLGDFIGVFPPPEFISQDCVGLIYKKADNLYTVEYFTFELSNEKICGIKQVD